MKMILCKISFCISSLFTEVNFLKARIYFIFLKNALKKLEMLLIPNFELSEKLAKAVSYEVRKIFALFWNFSALNLG